MKIAILGEGMTAKAVREKLSVMNATEVSLEKADLIVTSPGINTYPDTKAEIISEIEWAYRFLMKTSKPHLIAISGTNGKTTVTKMIAHLLGIPAVGNIGIPLVSMVDQNHPGLAIEVSSFQLETCKNFTPHIAVLTNLTPDHLDRHVTMENYGQAKAKIFLNQTQNHHLVYCQEDPLISQLVQQANAQKHGYHRHSPYRSLWKNKNLIGEHNVLNALAAIHVGKIMGLSEEKIKEKLSTFPAVEHRIEKVRTLNDKTFYNDSKATNPDSSKIAIQSFQTPVHLMLGGKDKGLDLEEFLEFSQKTVKSITTFGEIGPEIYNILKKKYPNFPCYYAENIEKAVRHAFDQAKPGDTILFSPASSSFDEFKNFEHRGTVFKDIVNGL